jgi:hypothetical protein
LDATKELEEQNLRIRHSVNFFSSTSSVVNGAHYNNDSFTKNFCIGITTTDRKQRYFIQTIASVVSHMDEDELKETKFIVLSGSKNHSDAQWISSLGWIDLRYSPFIQEVRTSSCY